MKRLTITYGDMTVFDGDVSEFSWTDTAGSVQVVGKIRTAAKSGGNILDALVSASKRQTQNIATEYRQNAEDQ